jgi:hypothetical protein
METRHAQEAREAREAQEARKAHEARECERARESGAWTEGAGAKDAGAGAGAGEKKRKREGASGARARPGRHVLVSCFDQIDRPIEVDTEILRPFNCMLYKKIRYDAPYVYADGPHAGQAFWKVSMTRAMLTTFMRSLLHGELSLSKDVSIAEALTTFEYENVTVGIPASKRAEAGQYMTEGGVPVSQTGAGAGAGAGTSSSASASAPAPAGALMRGIPSGVAFPKSDASISTQTTTICEQVAHALSRWPRLESVLGAALMGGMVSVSCTPSRCWIKFQAKPAPFLLRDRSQGGSGDYITELAKRWPKWLALTMTSIGIMHYRLVKENVIAKDARDASAYSKLVDAIASDIAGPWWCVLLDQSRSIQQGAHKISREILKAERFASDQRSCIIESNVSAQSIAAHFAPLSATTDEGGFGSRRAPEENGPGIFGATGKPTPRENLHFSRAVIALADRLIQSMASLTTVFSSACADDQNKSPERAQLAKSLKSRGITIVRWTGEQEKGINPLPFPNLFQDACSVNGPRPTSGVCVLLDFSNR